MKRETGRDFSIGDLLYFIAVREKNIRYIYFWIFIVIVYGIRIINNIILFVTLEFIDGEKLHQHSQINFSIYWLLYLLCMY
jgi:hypothetical protein